MGNRAYFSIKDRQGKNKTYYTHWNGGLDTFCPLTKVAFDHDVLTHEDFIEFMESLSLKPELCEEPEAYEWTEENGHYYIDLDKREVTLKTEDGKKRPLAALKIEFEKYLAQKILPDYQDETRTNYWYGVIKAGEEFFSKEKREERKNKLVLE